MKCTGQSLHTQLVCLELVLVLDELFLYSSTCLSQLEETSFPRETMTKFTLMYKQFPWTWLCNCNLWDTGAASQNNRMFVVKVYYKKGKTPWPLTLIEPVPEVFEFPASDWWQKTFCEANQRRRPAQWLWSFLTRSWTRYTTMEINERVPVCTGSLSTLIST